LADDAERVLVLEFGAPAGERQKAPALRLQPSCSGKTGLPDAGRSLDDDQSAFARLSTFEQRRDPIELRPTLEQLTRCRNHGVGV
jgi:hypothetical protein